jgi:hypothetical protein
MYEYIGILLGVRPILHISRVNVKLEFASFVSDTISFDFRENLASVKRKFVS